MLKDRFADRIRVLHKAADNNELKNPEIENLQGSPIHRLKSRKKNTEWKRSRKYA